MSELNSLVLVFVGGGIGSICRFVLDRFVNQQFGSDFPYGTLIVNIIGSFCIGLLFVALGKYYIDSGHRLFFATGFLGGFTTFSTFTLETALLFRNNQNLGGIVNILLSLILGLTFVMIGILLGNFLYKKG